MARWATVEEAAEYLRVHKGTLHNMISKNEGVGRLFKRGGPRLIVDLDDVDKLVKNGDC